MEEIADGQVWAESNTDNGPALFWFGFVHEDAKRVVAWLGEKQQMVDLLF